MSFIYTVNGNYVKNENSDCSDGKCLIFPNMINNKPNPQKKVRFADHNEKNVCLNYNKEKNNCEGKCNVCRPTTMCQNVNNICMCLPIHKK